MKTAAPVCSLPRSWAAALLLAALAATGCTSHGSPEDVARACDHQLAVSVRGAVASRLARAADPAHPRDARVDAAALDAEVAAALADPALEPRRARCRTLYAELPTSRLTCILAANDPVAINACTPQAERQRRPGVSP